jgi:hypothetical protein
MYIIVTINFLNTKKYLAYNNNKKCTIYTYFGIYIYIHTNILIYKKCIENWNKNYKRMRYVNKICVFEKSIHF